jgi:hypothetical protein
MLSHSEPHDSKCARNSVVVDMIYYKVLDAVMRLAMRVISTTYWGYYIILRPEVQRLSFPQLEK